MELLCSSEWPPEDLETAAAVGEAEHCFDPGLLKTLGCRIGLLKLSQPHHTDRGTETVQVKG